MSEQPPSGKPNYGSALRMAQMMHWLHQFPYGLSYRELTRRLGVSERTLHRYIQNLKENFFDEDGEPLIETVRSDETGRLRFKRKRVDMKGAAYELMSLYLALDLMAFLDGTFLHEGAQEVIDRLQQTLLKERGNETMLMLKDFHKKFFHWTEAYRDYSAHNELLAKLVKALVLQRKVEMVYQSPGKPEKTHLLEPLSMLMYKRALYLVGRKRVEGESKPRQLTFAVERVKSVRLTDDGFFYPSDYHPEQRFASSFGLVTGKEPVEVRLWFDPVVAENVSSRRWHPSQRQRQLEGGALELTLEVEPNAELISWIMGYGRFARVLAPDDLREDVVGQLRRALAAYEDG